MVPQNTRKGYFAYAELLFTLAMAMWSTVLYTEVTDLNRTPRIVELVLFGVIGVACIAIAIIKGRLSSKEFPWLWKVAAGYCAVMLVLLLALGRFSGIVWATALVAWIIYEVLVFRVTKRG